VGAWFGVQALEQAQKLVHHEVEWLNKAASLQLLRRHHHFTEQQLQAWGLLGAEEQLRAACSGLPLALQVIGGALAVPSCLQEEEQGDEDEELVKQTWEVRSHMPGRCMQRMAAHNKLHMASSWANLFGQLSW